MLIAYEVALDLVHALRPVVVQLRSYSPEATDQVERAASATILRPRGRAVSVGSGGDSAEAWSAGVVGR